MRDLDKIQAYEAKQQRLVEDIINSLHLATQEHKNYREVFGTLAVTLLQDLTNKSFTTKDRLVRKMALDLVDEPIKVFLEPKWKEPGKNGPYFAEREYLRLKVFEKVMVSVSSGIISAHQTEELKAVA
jgi:hypothetical protein